MSNPAYAKASYRRNRKLVLAAGDYRCQLRLPGCTDVATAADHVVALKLGGGHDLANLRPSCRHCNSTLAAQLTNQIRAAKKVGRRSRRW
jgi:5-methylcytosine-specific restriction endonuclease McrA